jgi:Cytochrome P450
MAHPTPSVPTLEPVLVAVRLLAQDCLEHFLRHRDLVGLGGSGSVFCWQPSLCPRIRDLPAGVATETIFPLIFVPVGLLPIRDRASDALQDIDDVGGKKILKGESVLCLVGSANRDPTVYPDRPDRLDISRPDVRPLSFGGGIHFCLGAQLARIESEIAIATLLRRLPNLRLDDAEEPEWRPTFVLRGLKRLPASW